jgi:solute carrier family 25 (mitochondrial phosphate transporter), member 3
MAATAPPTSVGSAKIDGAIQNVAANAPQKLSGVALYSRFAFAGAVCCAVTHGGLTPVDVYVILLLVPRSQSTV